jgi:hypothetical protein
VLRRQGCGNGFGGWRAGLPTRVEAGNRWQSAGVGHVPEDPGEDRGASLGAGAVLASRGQLDVEGHVTQKLSAAALKLL